MGRKTFADMTEIKKISVSDEYRRLIEWFYQGINDEDPLCCVAEEDFQEYPFRDTCTTLDDYDNTFGFIFPKAIKDSDLATLLIFCEYARNILDYSSKHSPWSGDVKAFFRNIKLIMEKISYKEYLCESGKIIYIPDSAEVSEVSAVVPPALSGKINEYNHRSNKGNLNEKLIILKLMADDIEPQRKELRNVNGTLESNLFQMLQKFVRHNNSENQHIAHMTPQEIEAAYDDIYQMWLLAKLELRNVERSNRIKALLGKINS